MSNQQQTTDNWCFLLHTMLQPDNAKLQNALALINPMLKQPQCVSCLMHIIASPEVAFDLRHLAVILLRRKIKNHWAHLSEELQSQIKRSLLELLTDVNLERAVKRAVASLVSVIAGISIVQGDEERQTLFLWSDVLRFIREAMNSPYAIHREIAMYIFSEMKEDILYHVVYPDFNDWFVILQKGVVDQDPSVSCATLHAIECFALLLDTDEEKQMFTQLLVPIMKVMQYCVDNAKEEVEFGFRIFTHLVMYCFPVMAHLVNELLTFMLDIIEAEILEDNLKQRAIFFIQIFLDKRPKTFLKAIDLRTNGSVLPRAVDLGILFGLRCLEIEEMELNQSALEFLNSFATNIPTNFLWETLGSRLEKLNNSSNILEQRFGLTILGNVCEGCEEVFAGNFQQVLALVMGKLCNTQMDKSIRRAAAFTMGEFMAFLSELIADHHAHVFPPFLQLALHDQDIHVRVKCWNGLRKACESVDSDLIVEYMDSIIEACLQSLSRPPTITPQELENMIQNAQSSSEHLIHELDLYELFLGTLSTCISAVEEAFTPYFPRIMSMLQMYFDVCNTYDTLRPYVFECVGIIGNIAEKELFAPHYAPLLNHVIEYMSHANPTVRAYCYMFIDGTCKKYGDVIIPRIGDIANKILHELESSDGLLVVVQDDVKGLDTEDGDHEDVSAVHLDEPYMEAKRAASKALGWIAFVGKEHFAMYIEKSYHLLAQYVCWFDQLLREDSILSLVQVLNALAACTCPDFISQRDVPMEQQPIPEAFSAAIDQTLILFIKRMKIEDSEPVIHSLLEAIGQIGHNWGPAALEAHLPIITEILGELLDGETEIQKSREVFEDDDMAYLTTEKTVGVISNLTDGLGTIMLPVLRHLMPKMTQYLDPERYTADYQMILIGEVSVIAEILGPNFEEFIPLFLPSTIENLKSPLPANVQNAEACICYILQSTKNVGSEYIQVILELLFPCFKHKNVRVIDNACGVMCAIFKNYHTLPLPFDQMLPILLDSLPLKQDHEPANGVYTSILYLLSQNQPAFMLHAPQIIALCAQEIVHGVEIDDDVKNMMLDAIRGYCQSDGGKRMNEIVGSLLNQNKLSNEEVQVLHHYITGA